MNPSQYIQATDGYTRTSHELRIASPQDNRFRVVAGLFWQQQEHQIHQRYRIDNLADSLSVSGWPDTIWLTQQERRDRDQAIFGQLSFDVTDKLELNAGGRWFTTRNSLKGYWVCQWLFVRQQSGSCQSLWRSRLLCAVRCQIELGAV